MLSQRTDLPLERDALSRFLPWIIAFMVYLAALTLAAVLVLNALAARWDQGASATLTVQIPPAEDAARDQGRLQAVLAVVRAAPGVLAARVIDEEGIMALLEPWLGGLRVAGDLPLPRLIDVDIDADADVDVEGLGQRLAAAVPGASVDDHRVWLDRLIRLIRAVETLAGLALALMGAAAVGTVVFTTRTGLAIHHEVIEVLHLIGSRDTYIARQFAVSALVLGLRGGLIGLALAVPTLLGVGYLGARLEAGLLPDLSLTPGDWAILAGLPPAAAAITMATAALTVTRSLTKMP